MLFILQLGLCPYRQSLESILALTAECELSSSNVRHHIRATVLIGCLAACLQHSQTNRRRVKTQWSYTQFTRACMSTVAYKLQYIGLPLK